jgi:hypothetical protein
MRADADRERPTTGRPPTRLWKALRPVVLALAALLAALGIPIVLRDPSRQGHRTAEVAPRDDDPGEPASPRPRRARSR